MPHVDINQNWEGDIDELVDEIHRVVQDPRVAKGLGLDEVLGNSKRRRKPRIANRRVITDYISGARGIMSRPGKRGRKSIYGLRHVMEFLAAKKMLKSKWPMEEIGGALRDLKLEELSTFVLGDTTIGEQVEQKRAEWRLKDLQHARNAASALGHPEDAPLCEQVTLIVVTTWCQLLVESRALAHVTKDQAEAIGSRVEELLLDQSIREQATGK